MKSCIEGGARVGRAIIRIQFSALQYSLCNDYNELTDFRVMPDAIYTCALEINLSLIIVLVDKK